MNLTAPIDEMNKAIDEMQSWLNLNKLVDQALTAMLQPLNELTAWAGQFAEMFVGFVKEKILDKLRPILDVIDGFLAGINAIIDAIQAIVDVLLAPLKLLDEIY